MQPSQTSEPLVRTPAQIMEARADAPAAMRGRHVMLVINSNSGGGVEHLASILIGDLEAMGARTTTQFVYPGANVSTGGKLRGLLASARALAAQRPDVVMAFQPTSAAVAGIVGRLTGCRTRIIHQSNMPDGTHPVPRLVDRLIGSAGFYTCNITNSAATEAAFAGHPASYRRRLLRIDHGVTWDPPARPREATRAGLGLPATSRMIFSAGRLNAQKSISVLIRALPDVDHADLVIAGDGPKRQFLGQLATELGVAGRVHFLGQLPHSSLADYYAACDVFAFPSLWETFGLALVEAAGHGASIVAARIPSSTEVMADAGASVSFVDAHDGPTWARALNHMLDDEEATAAAARFAPVIRERYGLERMLARYRRLYAELLP